MAGNEPRLLQYRLVDGIGRTNLTLQTGSFRCWLQVNWTSQALGGSGPEMAARLIEIGQCTESADAFCIDLYLTPDGNELRFGLTVGGEQAGDWVQTPIAWLAGEWHLVAVTYSGESSTLYVDGARAAEGDGVPAWLAEVVGKANIFSIGGDAGGENLAQGQFDELATFGYRVSDTEVKSYYDKLWPTVQLGPLTPEEEKAGEVAWAMPSGGSNESEEDGGEESGGGIPDYGCGLWLEITANTNAVATLTLHNTRSGAGYQILTNSDLTTTNWSLFLTNVADGSGFLIWTNIAINLTTNLFFQACEARDYVILTNFNGLAESNAAAAYIPDTMGAVGPNHFVELLNTRIAVYDKTSQLVVSADATNFFAIGTNFPAGIMIDPRILYDRQSNRWVACAIDVNSYQVRLAISKTDNPTNLTTGWDRYVILEKPSGADNDFTTLGLDSNGIYVRLLHRTFPGSQLAGHTVVAIKKPEIYQSQPITNFVYRSITNDVPVWTIQPAVNFDDIATNGYAWFIAKGPPDLGTNYQGGEILYRRLQWQGTNAVWADTNWIAAINTRNNYRNYYDLDGTNTTSLSSGGVVAPASGGGVSLYDTGSRLSAVGIRNGFLLTCQTIGLSGTNGIYSGDKLGTNVNRSAIQWLKLKLGPDGSTLTFSDHGRVFDSLHQTNAWWYYYSSLAVNCPGDMVAGFSGSSATNYIGAFYTWRLSSGSMFAQPRLLQPGTTAYSGEWGHYSATTLDPTDDWSFWTVQAYQTASGIFNTPGWATVVAKIKPNP